MQNKLNNIIWSLAIFLLPVAALAAQLEKTSNFFTEVQKIIKILIPIAFGLAVLFFFWGMAKYIWSAGGAKDEGKRIMVWGVVALFVMTMIWGIVSFIADSLGIEKGANAPKIPTINK